MKMKTSRLPVYKTQVLAVVLLFLTLLFVSLPWIVQGQKGKSKQGSFEGITPYTHQVEKPRPESGYELSSWGISITVQLDGTLSSKPGDKLKLVLYDKSDNKIVDSTESTGQFCVASLATTELNTKHEYEIKISSTPDGRGVRGSWMLTWVETEIKKGPCIIATATYGSELTPEVQFLRAFRDNAVLNTFAGKNFMIVFNALYYSFSPTVASIVVGNNLLRGFMRIILYPLIGILHLAATTYSLLNFSPEFAVVAAGLVASSLIGVTYFAPVMLILCRFKKLKIPTRVIQVQSLIWIISVACIMIAEIIHWPSMMMFSTGIFVLISMSISWLTFMKLLLDRRAN